MQPVSAARYNCLCNLTVFKENSVRGSLENSCQTLDLTIR
jgi:hypothetical protein